MQGSVTFEELHAATTDRKASAASASPGTATASIEARDAAPHSAHPEQPSPARQEQENRPGSGSEAAQPRRLGQIWEAKWSRLPIGHVGSSASHGGGASTSETRGTRPAVPPDRADHVADAGHISIGMSDPGSASADGEPEPVAVRLEVEEASGAGDAHVTIYLDVRQGGPAGRGMQHRQQSRLARQFDQVMQSQASAAALSGMQSLAGLLKAPHWARQAPPAHAAAPSDQGESAAEVPPAQDRKGADGVTASPLASVAGSDAAVQVDAPTKLVAVQIYVSENGAKLEANGKPCSVTMQISGDQTPAAPDAVASAQESTAKGRLGAFSGLFRSSRGVIPPQANDPGSTPPLMEATGEAESNAVKSQPLQATAGVTAQATGAAVDRITGERQNPAWAVAGAIGSLYGFVSHAAESAVRPGQQVGTPCTLLNPTHSHVSH
jgi:hypothetical protein